MERDIVKRIEDLMDLFDEGEVTTADQIQRPEDPYRDFNERNPMAGGGMLVQPSADGSRPGYANRKPKFASKEFIAQRDKGKDIPNKKIIHWTGDRGKQVIAEKINEFNSLHSM